MMKEQGEIEVICGCMFCGKSEELVRRLKRALIAKLNIQVFKPMIDNRYSEKDVVTHDGIRIDAIPIDDVIDMLSLINKDTDVVGIDEAQFFDEQLVGVCNILVDSGRRIVIAGLDQDYQGKPFGPMPELLAIADYVTKLFAVCMRCGKPASKTQRLVDNDEKILVGEKNIYEARCRDCWDPQHDKG